MQEDYYMMWLQRISGVSRKKKESLFSYYQNPKKIWDASVVELTKADGISLDIAERIQQAKNADLLEQWVAELEEKNIQYISRSNEAYPALLKEIYDPPLGLYIKGRLPDDDMEPIAIVGSRRCTEYGKRHAERFARELSEYNITIISGMARGIDSMAHWGAVAAMGSTVAVLGCGLDICYPPENERLMKEILDCGAIISEFPPKTPPLPGNFPLRNRIIAGLCKIIIVIEAQKKSGSLITAEIALEEGRGIFMLPGNIDSPFSQGTNNFIKRCQASLLTHTKDILEELGIQYADKKRQGVPEKKKVSLETEEKKVYDCISLTPIDMETLIRQYTGSVRTLQFNLSMLEMKGYVKRLPGQRFIRAD